MIYKVFYTEDSTYIDDDKGCTIRTDDFSEQQAIQLAIDTKAKFEYEKGSEWILRQCIHAFGRVTNTKTFFDFYTDVSMHIFNNNIIKNFSFDINNGFEYLFDLLINQEWERGYKNITNDVIECYCRDYIRDKLTEYSFTHPNNKMVEKYINIFNNYSKYNLNDIQREIWADNEDLLHKNVINWIDVEYSRSHQEMVLIGYNSQGKEVFRKTIEDVREEEAEETYSNIFNGMKSSDIYKD